MNMLQEPITMINIYGITSSMEAIVGASIHSLIDVYDVHQE